MKRKITLLIIASVIGLTALSAIQAYLIHNTYKLKKESFVNNSIESTSRIDDSFPKMDAISKIWHTNLLNLVLAYRKGEMENDAILPMLKSKSSVLDNNYVQVYLDVISNKMLYSDLKFQKRITAIVILHPIKDDTLFSSENSPKFHLLGDEFEVQEAHRIGRTTSTSEYTFDYFKEGEKITETLRFSFDTEDYLNIDDWEKNILHEMKGLFLISVLIFLLVFGLLFYSIKNLISQKKIADVKSDFINNISHEFKTPLATLSLAIQMLKTQATKSSTNTHEETLMIIERQNQRLQKLTDQVLNETLGYQEIHLQKDTVRASLYLSSVLDDFLLSINQENVHLSRNLRLQHETVSLDKFHMTTALFNILENAIKYSGEEAHIHCEASIDSTCRISIYDKGMGISEKDQVHVFDKFYRVGNKEIHDVKGLGLGLYYTKQIIKAHKGEIWVKSNEQEGTTFIIELPLR